MSEQDRETVIREYLRAGQPPAKHARRAYCPKCRAPYMGCWTPSPGGLHEHRGQLFDGERWVDCGPWSDLPPGWVSAGPEREPWTLEQLRAMPQREPWEW